MTKIAISMLAYNEGHAIEKTIRNGYSELEKLGIDFKLWLFDNCSTDNTEAILKNLMKELPKLNYYRQPENVGYAFSTRSTLKVPEADILVTIDGDGQYNFEDIKLLLNEIEKGADIVYANRLVRNDPFMRVFISSIFNIISKFVLNSSVRDLNCGFRAIKSAAAKKIEIENKLNFVGPEIYVRSKQNGLIISDVDVRHYERDGGISVYNNLSSTIRNSIKMFQYLLRLRKELNQTSSEKTRASESKVH